ncbi:MAG: flavodoxin family protein [Candidatus Bathyarchaeia archaeon]
MKVLGIVGSPHRDGNTATLVKAVIEGAREKGHETILFNLIDFKIEPLSTAEGKRVSYPEDDMVKLYPHIETMGALVLGTPVYYDNVSDRTKLFIDRLHYYSKTHGGEYRSRFPENVKAVTIIAYEWENPDGYDEILRWMNQTLEGYWGMRIIGSLKADSTTKKPVRERRDLLEKARQLGRTL